MTPAAEWCVSTTRCQAATVAACGKTWGTFPTCRASSGFEHDEIVLHVAFNRLPLIPEEAAGEDIMAKQHETGSESAMAIGSRGGTDHPSDPLSELIMRLAESADAALVVNHRRTPFPRWPVPDLTMPANGPRAPWLRGIIERMQIPGATQSPTNLAALKAGLFLLGDFFDDSHACSQSIEGLGAHHTGDYWHAILHRREPDYGNAKYWFRHVGRHPVFTDLAPSIARQLSAATGSLAATLERWRDRLVSRGHWDPLAFVDLCAAAETDAELNEWCMQVQFEEMLLLLESTIRESGQ